MPRLHGSLNPVIKYETVIAHTLITCKDIQAFKVAISRFEEINSQGDGVRYFYYISHRHSVY